MSPHRVAPLHEWQLVAFGDLQTGVEIQRLIADPTAVVVDGRLVITSPAGGDPGGLPV